LEPYPESPVARDRWIVGKRPARETLDPRRPAGWFLEHEPAVPGDPVSVLTVLLTNRECPWKCVFCDLWRHTLTDKVTPGDITAQLDLALGDPSLQVPRPAELKLYNAGSYFDAAAIPPQDDPAIASRAAAFRRLIVESHPVLVGDRCWRLRDRLRAGRGGEGTGLEVAMGLETVNPTVLGLLNKRVTLDAFNEAAGALVREGVSLRAFVLVQPPFEAPGEAVDWAVRSVEHAWNVGARVVTLIPVRGGNGALEALQAMGRFRPPQLSTLEAALEACLSRRRGLVMADTWDLEFFADCAVCFPEREERLTRMNLAQTFVAGGPCPACGWHAHSGG
jgi:radical SAM enzyme (TIGR01210 family)